VIFFEEKLKQNIGKPKELWKTLRTKTLKETLKDLVLPNKKSSGSNKVCLRKGDEDICFESKSNSEIFMSFFLDLAKHLLHKIQTAPRDASRKGRKESKKR